MMAKFVERFPYSVATLLFAVVVFLAAVIWDVNVFRVPARFNLIGIENSETGEICIVFLLTIPALFVDRVVARLRAYEGQLHAERLRVLRLTMRTVEDIVNNSLTELQLLRMHAEGNVPDEVLIVFDRTIMHTAAQITALGNLTVFTERPMASGPGLSMPDPGQRR
jgi:hypothetical protein